MNRRNQLRRAALLLALLVLAASVTGVAAPAAKTVVPKQLQGNWKRNGWAIHVYSSGYAEVFVRSVDGGPALFSRVTAHRLTIGDLTVMSSSCSGPTGTYRWTIAQRPPLRKAQLKLKKIHDVCKLRGNLFTGTWSKTN